MIVKILTAVFSRGADYGLRMFPLPHGDALRTVQTLDWTDEQGHAKDDAPIMDSEAEDPVLRLPANSAEGELLESTVLDSSYLQVAWGPRQDDERSYFILDVKHSGTAPDDWWELRLRLDPFAQLESLANLKGRWDATPEPNDAKLPFVVVNDAMMPSDTTSLPRLPDMFADQPPARTKAFFIKISSTEYLSHDRQGKLVKVENTPTTYLALVSEHLFSNINHDGDTRFPSLGAIIGDIDNLGTQDGLPVGLTPSSIVDISISARSPFSIFSSETGAYIKDPKDDQPFPFIRIGDGVFGLHQVTGWISASKTDYVTWPGLTDRQYYTGAVSLYDSNDARVASLPVQLMRSRTSIKIDTIMDVTGITTQVTLPGGISRITMPEGKLPFVGSSWAEYAVAQRSYDRENMTLAIQNAKSEATQNIMMNAANGVLTGALIGGPLGIAGGIAGTALGIAGSAMELQRNERTARQQQDLKEKMLINSPGTAFNTGYGTDYVRRSLMKACRIQIDMPTHGTDEQYRSYVDWHGYPAGGLESTVVLKQGYLQGYITDMTYKTKRERDRMNRELTEGVRFV